MAREENDAELWTDEYQKALEDIADQEFTPQKPVSEYEMGYEAGLRDAMRKQSGGSTGQAEPSTKAYDAREYEARDYEESHYRENSGRRVRKDSGYGGKFTESGSGNLYNEKHARDYTENYPEDAYPEDAYPKDAYSNNAYQEDASEGVYKGIYVDQEQPEQQIKKSRRQESKRQRKQEREQESKRQREQERYQERDRERMQGRDQNRKQNRNPGRAQEKKRRKNTFPVIVSIIILIILLPLLWLMKQLQGVNVGNFSIDDISKRISEQVLNSSESGAMAGYRNIALFGVDSTEGTLDAGNNRSDIMVIASINNKTGDIKLVSLYRDTYLDIGDGNYQKANAAYAYGGPEQAVNMLNTNLDLNITDYATVGFEGIARIIDAVGGIEIDVQQEEIEHLNNYQLTMSQETGMENIPVTQPGLQTLNGLQATAYCRIRYTEGNDFRRTERQREVLTKTFQKIKRNPVGIVTNMDDIMAHVRTSLSVTELLSLAPQAIQFSVTENSGVPVEEMRTVGYIGDQSCVIPITLASNVTWLHEYLFGDTGYTPSDTVQQISEHIRAVSGY